MAWMALIPLAASAIKTYMDQKNATSQDDAMRAAGNAKLSAMRQGAGQMEGYRQALTPQMLQAMNNQMQAYRPAQNVLSQMYGGHPGTPVGPVPGGVGAPAPVTGRAPMGMQSALAPPRGGLPMPAELLGRRVG